MLDVHAPEHPIGNLREFFLHLFTITCGLLIALGLENGAEALHHRHERKEAEAMIRQEIQENRAGAQKAGPVVLQELKGLQTVLTFVQARSEGDQQAVSSRTRMDFAEGELQDAAWRTASSTGVLSFMEYGEVERYSAAYKEQDLLQQTLERTLSDYLQLSSLFPANEDINKLSPQRATEALPYLRKTLGDLNGVLAIGRGTIEAYDEALR